MRFISGRIGVRFEPANVDSNPPEARMTEIDIDATQAAVRNILEDALAKLVAIGMTTKTLHRFFAFRASSASKARKKSRH